MVVGDGKIGITKSFGDLVPASNAGPRASGRSYVVNNVPDDSGELRPRPATYSSNALPAPCRQCGGPSWLTDDLGAVHPCCELNGLPCVACHTSEALNREQRRRGIKHLAPSAGVVVPTPTYSIGSCATCPRTSVRFYGDNQCYFCTHGLTKGINPASLSLVPNGEVPLPERES